MVEALLSGIVLGLVPTTIAGLFVAAWLQYSRASQIELSFHFMETPLCGGGVFLCIK